MTTGNPALIEFIRREIKEHGPVSFAWFMQQALYHSQHGYYSSGRCAIGRRGDYFTNISVGPLCGQLLAAQFAEIWERLCNSDSRREQGIDDFIIVEQGAHHGDFARDFLESARNGYPEFFAALCYRIIEPLPILQDRLARSLADFPGKFERSSLIDAIELVNVVHFYSFT